jgi:hypothetical protein
VPACRLRVRIRPLGLYERRVVNLRCYRKQPDNDNESLKRPQPPHHGHRNEYDRGRANCDDQKWTDVANENHHFPPIAYKVDSVITYSTPPAATGVLLIALPMSTFFGSAFSRPGLKIHTSPSDVPIITLPST